MAREIQAVFKASYEIEAKLLGVTDFPPLNRKISEYMESNTDFYGISMGKEIAAIIEVAPNKINTKINSLVVHPRFFRQGLGKKLIQFVLTVFDSELFTVETGLKNEPAIALYKNLGFAEQEQWDTEIGIKKIKLVKN